jgi:hypothetical protein
MLKISQKDDADILESWRVNKLWYRAMALAVLFAYYISAEISTWPLKGPLTFWLYSLYTLAVVFDLVNPFTRKQAQTSVQSAQMCVFLFRHTCYMFRQVSSGSSCKICKFLQ